MKKHFGKHILVIGDILLDKYIYGVVNRMSPEAPVPILLQKKSMAALGGAANVAHNLSSFGFVTTLIGCVGDDTRGEDVIKLVKNIPGNHLVIIDKERKTSTKTRILNDDQQVMRVDDEDDKTISDNISKKIVEHIETLALANKIEGIVFSDYDKGMLHPELICEIITLCKKNNIHTFADPKVKNYWYYKGVTLFKPNKKELLEAYGDESISFEATVIDTSKKIGCKYLACTMADQGIACVKSGEVVFLPAHNTKVKDVSGAGDSALVGIVTAVMNDLSLNSILLAGNVAGWLACQKVGVSVVAFDVFEKNYNQLSKKN